MDTVKVESGVYHKPGRNQRKKIPDVIAISLEEQDSATEKEVVMLEDLIQAFLNLRLGDHLCYIYSRKDQLRAVAPFIQQGLERKEQCIYIADDNSVEEVTQALVRLGVNVSSALATGRLNIITKTESYVREGFFDPDRMIAFLQEATDQSIAKGYTGLRATGEMTWSLAGHAGSERLIEHEAKLNHFFPRNRALALCQYNAERFTPDVLLDVIKTHPLVVYGDQVCRNFYYIPPDEFLREKKDPEKELSRRIRHIRGREEVGQKLRDRTAQLEHEFQELDALNRMFQQHLTQYYDMQEAYSSMRQAIGKLVLVNAVTVGKQETGPRSLSE